jgi:hypothetical protein
MLSTPKGQHGPRLLCGATNRTAMLIFLSILPIAAAAVALLFRDNPWIRRSSVVIILIAFGSILGLLIAPHRLAEELLGSPPGSEWLMGARATRDIAHDAIPVVVSAVLSLAVIALLPLTARTKRN